MPVTIDKAGSFCGSVWAKPEILSWWVDEYRTGSSDRVRLATHIS